MSQFVVSARKYRPVRFEDVVGQLHVSQTLKNALQRSQLAHAYLFCGPRGVGKTTCARILAKVLNCEARTPDFEACDTCGSCKAFNENASFNITELDAASNNSVEHIRGLVEQVRFAPQQGRYKIYIIDEVHMLSTGAFNAFLKTLEEPPPYAIFILATTEKNKIIPTILSRCQIYDFRRITVTDMAAHLQRICDSEGIVAEQEALHTIAQKADGALRDALSLFDRIISATGGKQLLYADVVGQLNILDYDYYFKLTDALLSEDLSAALLLFDEILRKGFEPDLFVNGLADHLRNLLVCQDPQTLALIEGGDTLRDRYARQAALAPTNLLLTGLHVLNDCDVNFRTARNRRLHVEMALIRLAYAGRRMAPQQLEEKKKSDLEDNESVDTVASVAEAAPAPKSLESPAPGAATAVKADPTPFITPSLDLSAIMREVEADEIRASQTEQELTLSFVSTVWQDYLATTSPIVQEMLRATQVGLEGKIVKLTVSSEASSGILMTDLGKLRERILSEMDMSALQFEVLVDTSLAPINMSEPVKKLSNKEKYDLMMEQNPLIEEFRTSFDLKLDNEK